METTQLVERLRSYNEWRRGEHEAQPSPSEIGLWIDEICKKVDDQCDRIRELWEAVAKLNKDRDILLEKSERYRREANAFMLQRDEAREACKEAQYESEVQARLLGMSGERESELRGKIFELERKIKRLETK